jgi:hypothetical protein
MSCQSSDIRHSIQFVVATRSQFILIHRLPLNIQHTKDMEASSDPYPWQEPVLKPARGAFIVIEGLDRAGKTTQVKRLCDKLYAQGHNIKNIRFPGIYPLFHVIISF